MAPNATWRSYAGLFAVALSTLMYEVVLTRIFSVTMWYHFSFLAISVAMFGMSAGAVLVYLFPNFFDLPRLQLRLAQSSFWFSLTIVITFITHLCIPFGITSGGWIIWASTVVLTYVIVTIPFVFSGVCVCLALTRYVRYSGWMYAADLAGAAVGCLALVWLLGIMDGPTAVIAVAAVAAAGSLFFADFKRNWGLVFSAGAWVVLLGAFIAVNSQRIDQCKPLIRPFWVKGGIDPKPVFEKWNSFSRITIAGDYEPLPPFGWGLSSTAPTDVRLPRLNLAIDAGAATILTDYQGNIRNLEFLRYDLVNLAHHLRDNSRVLVVGAGGGRDVLSGVVFKQKAVIGVEINENIIAAVNQNFGKFTGHLDRLSNVTFVNDEARSYIARQTEGFDIIQISLIDTWAATAAGAFVLAENSLYTTESWEMFLKHLTDRGILSVSRWYYQDRPGELYRVAALAAAALQKVGVQNPRQHILIATNIPPDLREKELSGIGTVLVSRQPLLAADVEKANSLCKEMKFNMLLDPGSSPDFKLAQLAGGERLQEISDELRMDVTAPTDDRPFFFNQLRLKDLLRSGMANSGPTTFNMRAVVVLAILMITVIGLSVLCLGLPMWRKVRRTNARQSLPLLVYFGLIGLAFMFVEISQMQRLIVFLGHPTYGLTVVLFSLLLSAGVGSLTTQGISTSRSATYRLVCLVGVLIVSAIATPSLIQSFDASVTAVRILLGVCMLVPMGLFMGMAFPLGIQMASRQNEALTPWLWALNGATSVCASVFAIVVSMFLGISFSFWTGVACYAVALAAFVYSARRETASK